MSWEDCGFKPGVVNGPAKCPKGRCGDCDGEHHFYVTHDEPRDDAAGSDWEPEMYFVCKHCDATAAMVPDDELDDEDEG